MKDIQVFTVPLHLILKDKDSTNHISYFVVIHDLGFYIRTLSSTDGKAYTLIDMTTRNKPEKVTRFLEKKKQLHLADNYRVIKEETTKAYYNPKNRRYSHERNYII